MLGILDRWERHPDVEAIWDKIKPALPPEIFILAILKTGRVAAKIDRLAHELPREAKPISRIERFLTERQLGQGNRFLAWLGDLRQGQERLLSRNTETAARTPWRPRKGTAGAEPAIAMQPEHIDGLTALTCCPSSVTAHASIERVLPGIRVRSK